MIHATPNDADTALDGGSFGGTRCTPNSMFRLVSCSGVSEDVGTPYSVYMASRTRVMCAFASVRKFLMYLECVLF